MRTPDSPRSVASTASLRRFAAPYFVLQGALVALWWAALLLRPELRAWFQPPGSPWADLLAFVLPDLLLLAAGSFAAAYATGRGARWSAPAAWLVAGAAGYATLYCLALSLATGAAWAGFLLMLPAALLSLLFAATVSP